MGKHIVISYNPDGSVEVEAQGFSGTECLEGTATYEKALGLKSSNSTKKMKTGSQREGVKHGVRNRIHTRR